MSRSKAKGTATETAAQRWLVADGWADCERIVQHGVYDQGDLVVCRTPKVIAECKGGAQAETASAGLIGQWLAQTEAEQVHAGAVLAVLIVRRHRRPVALWDAWMPAGDWAGMLAAEAVDEPRPLRGSLADWSAIAREWVDS